MTALISRAAVTAAAKTIVNASALPMFSNVGIREITEIWFPPYMTSIAPTRTEGDTMPMNTPAEHETAIIERLIAKDCAVFLRIDAGIAPVKIQSAATPTTTAIKLAIATQV